MATTDSPPRAAATPFDSLEAMQARHAELVKEVGKALPDRGQVARVVDFVHRGRATGAVLDARDDRAAAQGLVNFWASRVSAATAAARAAAAAAAADDGGAASASATDPLPEIDDTLLDEFDPASLESAQSNADRWLDSLPPDDRDGCRRILLRLVRLPDRGRTFVPTPTTRDTLRDVDGLTSGKVDELIAGLARAGVVRVARGDSPGLDRVALRGEPLLRNWATLRGFLDRRLEFRDAVSAWGAAKFKDVPLYHGDPLNEVRGYHDRNELERRFVEASRREEWRKYTTNRNLLFIALPLLVIALLGWGMTAALNRARLKANDALLAVERELAAKKTRETEETKDALRVVKAKQNLTAMTTLVGTLAVCGNTTGAEKEIAFRSLALLRQNAESDSSLARFFEKNPDIENRLRGSNDYAKSAHDAALVLAHEVRDEYLREATALGRSQGVADEIARSFAVEREVVFDTAAFCAAEIVRCYETGKDLDVDGYGRVFWVLYWGEMGLVEGDLVSAAMVDFGKTLNRIDERVMHEVRTGSPGTQPDAKGLNAHQYLQQVAREVVADGAAAARSKVSAYLRGTRASKADVAELRTQLEALRKAMDEEKRHPLVLPAGAPG